MTPRYNWNIVKHNGFPGFSVNIQRRIDSNCRFLKITKIKRQIFIGIGTFDSCLYFDISRSFIFVLFNIIFNGELFSNIIPMCIASKNMAGPSWS